MPVPATVQLNDCWIRQLQGILLHFTALVLPITILFIMNLGLREEIISKQYSIKLYVEQTKIIISFQHFYYFISVIPVQSILGFSLFISRSVAFVSLNDPLAF